MYYPTDIVSAESCVLFVLALLLARYYVLVKWKYLEKLQIPHDPPRWLGFGHMRMMYSKAAFRLDNENKKKFGPIWGFYMGTAPNIVVHDLEIARRIFIKEFPSFPVRHKKMLTGVGKEIGSSLVASNGKQWKRMRSTMTPTFSSSKLKLMTGIIERCVENTLEVFARKNTKGDGTFSARQVFARLSLDVVGSSAFSTNVHSQDDTEKDPEIVVQAEKLFSGSIFGPLFYLCLFIPYFDEIISKLGINVFMQSSATNYFKNLSLHVMKMRKDKGAPKNRVDLMQLMLDSEITDMQADKGPQKGMTRTEIIGNSMLMLLAGYETTGMTMLYFVYNMAFHPEIQSQLQKEIDEMLNKNEKLNVDDVNSLKLLDMCVQETLRLYNPVLRISRFSTKEITISGFTVPKNIQVFIPAYALGHDPEYWENPMEFDPERMRDMSVIDPMLLQSFGSGPRSCIGMKFAIMEIKIAMCKILHEFTFLPCPDTPKPPLELEFGMRLNRPTVEFNLRAVPRDLGQ